MADRASADTEQQLQHDARALHRLARGLLGPDDADDVVQSAFAAALAAPGGDRQHLGLWLRGTVRKLAQLTHRRSARRRDRERRVARSAIDCRDPAALAMQAELVAQVGNAVRALDEPFRSAILLRYWHGLSAAAIAQQLAVPHNTVRSRLQRGLAMLRAEFDGQYGDRERWAAPLGALVGVRAAVPAAVTGGGVVLFVGMLMKGKLMLGAAAVLLAAAALSWSMAGQPASPPTVTATPGPAPVVADSQQPPTERREVAAAPAPPPSTSPSTSAEKAEPFDPSPPLVEPWLASFLVVDEGQVPVDDASIRIWAATRVPIDPGVRSLIPDVVSVYSDRHASTALAELHTGADGRAATTLQLEQVIVAATSPQRGDSGERPLHHMESRRGEIRLIVEQPIPIRGVVRAADGSPVAGAVVSALSNGGSIMQRGKHEAPAPAISDAEGRFELPGHLGCTYVVSAEASGARTLTQQVEILDHAPKQVVLTFPGAITIDGLVLDSDDQPVAKARVSLWREFHADSPQQQPDDFETADTTTKADGKFSLPVHRFARYQLLAAADGWASSDLQWTETNAVRPYAHLVLRLAQFLPLAGHVVHADGSPFAGVIVRARPESGQGERGGSAVPSARDRFPRVPLVTTDADGAFAMRVAPGTNWTLFAQPSATEEMLAYATLGVIAGSLDNRIVLDAGQVAGCRVRGTVVADADSAPIEEFGVDLLHLDELTGLEQSHQLTVSTDGNRFSLPLLPLGARFSVIVHAFQHGRKLRYQTRFAPAHCGPFVAAGGGLEVRARLPMWAEVPVRVLQADGSPATGVLVNTLPVDAVRWWPTPLEVDGAGFVLLTQRPPGVTGLTVWNDQTRLCAQDLTLLPGRNPEVVVHLPVAATNKPH